MTTKNLFDPGYIML